MLLLEEERNGWEEEGEGDVVADGRLRVSSDVLEEGGWRRERERWMSVLLEPTFSGESVGREMEIVGCLEGEFDRWASMVMEGKESGVVAAALVELAESDELLVEPSALLLPDSVPEVTSGLRLEPLLDMDMLLPLLLRVPTSLPSPSERPGKLKSSSTTSNAAPGFITRVISSKRSSHYLLLA